MKTSHFSRHALSLAALLCAAGCGGTITTPSFPEGDASAETDAAVAADGYIAPDAVSVSDVVTVTDAVAPSDQPSSFCALVDCREGTYCCEPERACIPAARRCGAPTVDGGASVDASLPTRCNDSSECGRNRECVFPADVCVRDGRCAAAIACVRPEVFCSCSDVTYRACRPDRPTAHLGACAARDAGTPIDTGTSFCALVRCAAGTRCCEARRACIPNDQDCPGDPVDAGVAIRCRDNSGCDRGSYCASNTCGGAGTCAPRPTVCTREYAPVCGCDGRTYSNACVAQSSGVNIASRGECASDAGAPVDTGTSFCALVRCVSGTRCCEARRACIPNDEVCPGDPVDAGVTGCASSRDCRAGECVFPLNACSTLGSCQPQLACLRPETFCACNGTTYQACRPDRPTRAMGACPTAVDAGTRCASDRDCATGNSCCQGTGQCYPSACLGCCMVVSTRCTSNSQCASGQYCAGSGCDTAGACTARPQACPLVYNPVCGCDGRTYGNSCEAASRGVRVAASGECRS